VTKARQVIFIDFHGTICHDLYWRSLPLAAQPQLQSLLFGGDTLVVDEWMRGDLWAEQVNTLVADELGLPYETVWRSFVADCCTMHVAPATLARIARIRQHAAAVLITGNMDSFTRFTVPALNLQASFDAISSSSDEGRLKTDQNGALFLHYADRFGAQIEQCVVIDDAADVCATFARLGGTALQVTPDVSANAWLDSLVD
jgi:FMN phosphatase YigB (HAD superfamily)